MKMKATAVWVKDYKCMLDNGRGQNVVVDLPIEQGGTNAGPMAIELCLMSLAGCIVTVFKIIAEKRRFAYTGFKVELEAEKDKDSGTIANVGGRMEIVTDREERDAQTTLRLTIDNCPIGILFDQAKVKFNWTLKVKKP